MTSAQKVIGILGGMGPEATVDLFMKIVAGTPAKVDQEHLRIIVDCNPHIPSRQEAILERGEDPTALLCATALGLQRMGAELIAIPCNTAHYYLPQIQAAVGIPVINMIEVAARNAVARHPKLQRAGLLAATGAIKAGLYQRQFAIAGVETLPPTTREQSNLMESLSAIKAGSKDTRIRESVLGISRSLVSRGAEVVILGCSELPLIMQDGDLPVPMIDATQTLADELVALATNGNRSVRQRPNRR